MIRVLVPLCGIVSLFAADPPASAGSIPWEAFAPPAIRCEQSADTSTTPTPRSEADIGSIMRRFTTHSETLSQMEAWWRERSNSSDAAQGKQAPSMMKDVLAQMEAWWRERPDLHNGIPREQSPSAMKETITRMKMWWAQRVDPGNVLANKPASALRRRRHRQASRPGIEYGCPPSVCTIQYGNQ